MATHCEQLEEMLRGDLRIVNDEDLRPTRFAVGGVWVKRNDQWRFYAETTIT